MEDARIGRLSDSEPEMEDERFEALQEFVIETMGSFRKELKKVDKCAHETRDMMNSLKKDLNHSINVDESKLSELESRVESNTSKIQSMANLVIKEKEMEDDEIIFEPCASSSPEPPRKCAKFRKVDHPKEIVRIPEFVEDVQEEDLRMKLKEIEGKVNYAKEKEKLSYVQLLFVHHWIEENGNKTSGRSEQVLKLIREGEERKLWPKHFKPKNVKGDFFSYMQEKMKNMAKRKRINSQKDKINDLFSIIQGE